MGLKNDFLGNPIEFLKMHPLEPPSGTAGAVINSWTVPNAGNIADRASTDSSKVSLQKAGAKRMFAQFMSLPTGALSVDLNVDSRSPEAFEQFWLPWESLAITKNHIPAVPATGGANFPSVFITAGINGCSVFVDGPANSPTVYHAGITGKLARHAEDFWREQLGTALGRTIPVSKVGQVHSYQYMDGKSQTVTNYLSWLNDPNKNNPYKVELLSNFGAVVGIRTKSDWRFYLQKNVMIQDVQIVKRSQVTSVIAPTGVKQYMMKNPGNKAPGNRVERTFGPPQKRMFLPDKVTKIYTQRINTRATCVKVVQIFPTREHVGDWTDLDVRAVG